MQLFRDQAERFGAAFVDGMSRASTSASALQRCGSATTSTGRLGHRGHRSIGPVAGAANEERSAAAASPPAPPATASSSASMRSPSSAGRHRPRGGALPDPVRLEGHDRSSAATSSAAARSCRTARSRIPRSRSLWNKEVTEVHGDRRSGGSPPRHHQRRGVRRSRRTGSVRGHRLQAEHRPVRGQLDLDERGYCVVDGETGTRRSRASSSPATCTTTATARRSPPPATAARPRSTRSAGSSRSARSGLHRDQLVSGLGS